MWEKKFQNCVRYTTCTCMLYSCLNVKLWTEDSFALEAVPIYLCSKDDDDNNNNNNNNNNDSDNDNDNDNLSS